MHKLSIVVLVLGVLAAIAYTVVTMVADSDSDKHALVPLPPGASVVALPAGTVGLWYRERVKIDEDPDDIEPMPLPPGLQVRVRAAEGGDELGQDTPSGLFRTGGTGDMEAQLLSTIDVPREGRYAVRVSPRIEGRRDAAIGFGTAPSFSGTLRHLLSGAIIAFGGFAAFVALRVLGRFM